MFTRDAPRIILNIILVACIRQAGMRFRVNTSLYISVYIMGEDRNTDSWIDFLSWDRLDEDELSQMTLIEKINLSLKLKDFTKVSVSTFMPPKKRLFVVG